MSQRKKRSFLGILELIFAPKLFSGTYENIKKPTQMLGENVSELISVVKKRNSEFNQNNTAENGIFSGREHFCSIMENERVTPEMYEQEWNKRHILHWLYFVAYVATFFWLFYLFFRSKEYAMSSIFFFVTTLIYLKISKENAEYREQEFMSLSKFFSMPNFGLIPTKKRLNEYFVIDMDKIREEEKRINEVLNGQANGYTISDADYKEFKAFQEFKRAKEKGNQQSEQESDVNNTDNI